MADDRNGILLVTEDPNLLSLSPALAATGTPLRTARNVFEAIVAFSSAPAAAVLIDLKALDPRALEVVPAIHRIAPGIPVVLLFGPAEREVLAHGIALGATGALPKPFYVSEAVALALPRPAPAAVPAPPAAPAPVPGAP